MRGIAALLAATTLLQFRPATGAPGDIFTVAAPAIGTTPQPASSQKSEDASVSPTGALTYQYPINVAQGRQGMQPHLSLAYNSQGAIYGGIAAQWSLSGIPIVEEDTSGGRLDGIKKFQSSLAGNRPFVPVSECGSGQTCLASDVIATFRAQNDSTWTRFEKMTNNTGLYWRAYTPDGATYRFGETSHVGACTIISESYAPLTSSTDKFGNAVNYYYRKGPSDECLIDFITWGENASANLGSFAAVTFNFQEMPTCAGVPIGAQTSLRTGSAMTGASRLTSISATVFQPIDPGTTTLPPPDHTRQITLSYDANAETCAATSKHAAYRSLHSIQESAWGTNALGTAPRVDLPAVTFSYGSADFGTGALAWQPSSSAYTPWTIALGNDLSQRFNLGYGFRWTSGSKRWPTVDAMLIDVDGDGLVDRLVNFPLLTGDSHVVRCGAGWMRNRGNMVFDPAVPIAMPTLKWGTPQTWPESQKFDGGQYAGQDPS